MKNAFLSVLLLGGFMLLSTIDASAYVCARGVLSGGLRWAARRRRCQTSIPSLRQGLSLMGSAIDFTAIQCGAAPHLVPR